MIKRHAIALSLLLLWALPLKAEVVHIAAAANFKSTVMKINALFEAQSKHKVVLSSASTGTLHSQIQHGAPFDIFFAADITSALKLEEGRYAVAGHRFCYAIGSLVLVGSNNPKIDIANAQLSLAIANPNTAPYGKAAIEILQREEFAIAHNRKLVRASNVAQAFQHWYSGAVDLALVPAALALEVPTTISHMESAVIDPNWYTAIEQHVIALQHGEKNPAAVAYMHAIRSEQVQAVIRNAGYGSCP